MKNNLIIADTGLDHLYIEGIPIVEAIIDIDEVYKKVARISSLAVQADPYFDGKTNAQKLFSESHGNGDRITKDFLEEGARDLLPIFSPLQRLIPEGTYDTTIVEEEALNQTKDYTWTNSDTDLYTRSVEVRCTSGSGSVTFTVNGTSLGTVTLPVTEDDLYLPYDLSGFLGGISNVINTTTRQNVRNNNVATVIECVVESDATADFVFDIKIVSVRYDAIGWIKALTDAGDVYLPTTNDDIRITHLIGEFEWANSNSVKVRGATVKHNSGSAYVSIHYNGEESTARLLDSGVIGEDYFSVSDDITTVEVRLFSVSDDFSYDLIINTELPDVIPSPRFEFDSTWNEGKVIFRYQNMDTRDYSKRMNYTSETLRDIRVDPNIFDEVLKYLKDSLKNYILKELYLAIGYDKKADEYFRKYEKSRESAKFWVRSEKGLQTQLNYAGV